MLPLGTLIPGWLLTFVIVAGNALVIFLITTRRNLRTTTNWFILSLAVADFGFGTFYFPRYSSCWMYKTRCVDHAVIVVGSIGYFFAYASVTNLCALTLDRYLAIVKPLRYVTFMTKRRVALLISAAWGVAFVVLVIIFKIYSAGVGKPTENSFWVSINFLSVIACGILMITTAQVVLIVRRKARQNATVVAQLNFNNNTKRCEIQSAGSRVGENARNCGDNLRHLLFSNSFVNISNMFKLFPRNTTLDLMVLPLFKLANSAVNPVAYAFYK